MVGVMIIFLGAGASAPFDYPTMPKLADMLWNQLSGENKTLLDLLYAHKNGGDTEDVLRTIGLVDSLANNPIAPIFKPYQLAFMIRGIDLHRSYSFDTLVEGLRSLRERIYDTIFEVYQTKPTAGLKFELYSELLSIIGKGAKEYLIFTTNYDTIIEDFCVTTQRYELRDGFEPDPITGRYFFNEASFDRPVSYAPKPPIKLFKLHGSLGWKESVYVPGVEKVTLEKRVAPSPTHVHTRDLVIYPGSKEPPDERPFTYLYDRFETEMKNADRCLVIGYSFRDVYLNRVFRNFIRPEKRLYVMSKSLEEKVRDNLLRLSLKDGLNYYVSSKMVVPIPCHFGDNGWSKELVTKLEEL